MHTPDFTEAPHPLWHFTPWFLRDQRASRLHKKPPSEADERPHHESSPRNPRGNAGDRLHRGHLGLQ